MAEFTDDGIDRTTTLKVSGLTCGHCVAHVTEELEAIEGVKNVSVLLNKGGQSTVTVVSDVLLPDSALAAAIDEAGDYTLDAVERDS
ncbi:heavy-metal-associated domain-containing protein [Actinomyces bowdenii]|uniref:heavy-metal-associated domain-containing protein n=1 Tax=Actinomyces bowdenii TaxID=131109 RepID=UPI001ABCAF08|nr:heavy-metal-associated domain-containing protein [Actinomyces bowdenii]MBO3724999.1 heavy-metal-associated domain-containing protein [Actinomyces bowdenii]